MPRVNTVKKARKAQGRCGRCGTEINVGDAYMGCTDFACRFRASDLTGGKMSGVYAAQENAEDSIGDMDSVEDIKNLAEETADSIQEVADEYQESADAISEHFEGSSTAEECEEQAQNLGDWAETIRDSVSDFEDEFKPTNGFNEDGDRVCPDCGGEVEEDGEYFICCDVTGCGGHGDLEDDEPRDDEGRTREEWVEAARDALNDALGECPC